MKPVSIHHLFSEIESDSFFGDIALLNDFNSFLIFVETYPIIHDLIIAVSFDQTDLKLLKDRIKKLLNFECDKNKLHPYDHVLAIYLYAIFKSSMIEVEAILKSVYKKRLKNLYWTYLAYNYILENLPKVSTSYCEIYQTTESENLEPIDIRASNSDKKLKET